MKRLYILLAAMLLLFSGCGGAAGSSAAGASNHSADWGKDYFGAMTGATLPSAEVLPSTEEASLQEATETVSQVREADAQSYWGTITEDRIFSYLQGSGSYDKGLEWAGDWCYIDAGGGRMFYSFGCGICCLTNMYCTLTGNPCTPGEMYEWAKEETSYSPGPGGGAIDWPEIDQMCQSRGFGGTLCRKPEEYSQFQRHMASATTIMVLVSSEEDDAIWKDLPGHYVNLWLYDPAEDTVFLSDSRGPATNRTRVALRDVYNALLTSESYQYYLIE